MDFKLFLETKTRQSLMEAVFSLQNLIIIREKVLESSYWSLPASLEGVLVVVLRSGVWSPWLQLPSSLQAPAQGLTTSILGTEGPGEHLRR